MARAIHESTGVKDAFPWYERAVREEPENPMPYYFLGFAYKDRGQKAKAVHLFKQYLVKRPDAEDKKDILQEIEDLGG
jgi:tetratricopeptide (TPR) repeat protein